MKSLLELRKKIKAKKPNFIREDAHKKPRVRPNWRLPKGMHSKIRHKKKGHQKMPRPGYGSPVSVRGLHKSGLEPILLVSLKGLDTINKSTQGVIIASSMGDRKRVEALKIAAKKGIRVLNIKNSEEYIKGVEEKRKQLKEEKKQKIESEEKKSEKKVAKETKDIKKEDKEGLKDVLNEEEKKMQEKKDMDKALIKKGLQ
jgi:large subunit ribosomal protein L32e